MAGTLLDAAKSAHNDVIDASDKAALARMERARICRELRENGVGPYRIAKVLGVSATAVQQWTEGKNR